jgi:hypothetical protein
MCSIILKDVIIDCLASGYLHNQLSVTYICSLTLQFNFTSVFGQPNIKRAYNVQVR